MFTAVRAMRDAGVAVIYISHRLDELAQITDRVTVLRDGAVVASRPTSEFSVRDVAELMVGHVLETARRWTVRRRRPTRPWRSSTSVAPRRFDDVSFTVRPGEIVALYGLIGCGAGDVIRAPVRHRRRGLGRRAGQRAASCRSAAPADAVAPGHVDAAGQPQDPGRLRHQEHRLQHLQRQPAPAQPVRDLDGPRRASGRSRTTSSAASRSRHPAPARRSATCPAATSRRWSSPGSSSSGRRSCCWRSRRRASTSAPRTRSTGSSSELADAGTAVLVVSTDLAEVQYLADRVLVMRSGSVSAEFGRGARQAELLAAAAGRRRRRRDGAAPDDAATTAGDEPATRTPPPTTRAPRKDATDGQPHHAAQPAHPPPGRPGGRGAGDRAASSCCWRCGRRCPSARTPS